MTTTLQTLRAPLVNPQTGIVTKEGLVFLRDLFDQARAGISSAVSPFDEIQYAQPGSDTAITMPSSEDFGWQGAYLQPPVQPFQPSALTRVNDTNVTLTLGGLPTQALLQPVSITVGWSSQLGLSRGGTNADLSATGGTGRVLKQTSSGAAVTVATVAASEISSPAALTKSDDTNVTLTLGGSPSTALLAAASIAVGWTGTLSSTRGGTGQNWGASSGVPLATAGTFSLLTYADSTSWTVTVTSGGGEATYSSRTAKYVRIGPFVLATFDVTIATLGTMAAGQVTIGGLPATVAANTNYASLYGAYWAGMSTNWITIGGIVNPGGTTISLYGRQSAGTSQAAINDTDISTSFRLAGSVVFIA